MLIEPVKVKINVFVIACAAKGLITLGWVRWREIRLVRIR